MPANPVATTTSRRIGVAFARKRSSALAWTSASLMRVLEIIPTITKYPPKRKKGRHSVSHPYDIFDTFFGLIFARISACDSRIRAYTSQVAADRWSVTYSDNGDLKLGDRRKVSHYSWTNLNQVNVPSVPPIPQFPRLSPQFPGHPPWLRSCPYEISL